jgi:AraC-like DNA-binding protein
MPRSRRTAIDIKPEFERATAVIRARSGEEDFCLRAVAVDLHCSPRQVQRILATYGTSFRIELTRARMVRGSAALIERGSVRIAASQAGYSHARHFSRAYTRYYRICPRRVIQASKVAARLRRKAASPAPALTSPRAARHFRAWRADHRRLVQLLRGRRHGTALDDYFRDALALRGPDLRTTDGRRQAEALAPTWTQRAARVSPFRPSSTVESATPGGGTPASAI